MTQDTTKPELNRLFWNRLQKGPEIGIHSVTGESLGVCWFYKAAIDKNGYCRIRAANSDKRWLVHRLLYTIYREPIPDCLELDHLCRNRSCCNPDHLEAVTHHVNMQRGELALGTTCVKGHSEFEPNPRTGGRQCAVCRREFVARKNAAKVEARTTCRNGHPFELSPSGKRYFPICAKVRAAKAGATISESRTHCASGHAYELHAYHAANGKRICRLCEKASEERRKQRRNKNEAIGACGHVLTRIEGLVRRRCLICTPD